MTSIYMPQVDPVPAGLFDTAREMTQDRYSNQRFVTVITPGRAIMQKSCPPPGTMKQEFIEPITQIVPPYPPRRIIVIAFNELAAIQNNLMQAIPFFGYLMGLGYIGHSVTVFEGHPTALAIGCRGADLLVVDQGMIPHLQRDWQKVAFNEMRSPEGIMFGRDGSIKPIRGQIFSIATTLTEKPAERSINTNATLQEGIVLYEKGDYRTAAAIFNQLIQKNPQHWEAYIQRARTKNSFGDYNGALADIEIGLKHLPNSAQAYMSRGYAYHYKKDMQRALENYNRALQIDPRHERALGMRGMYYYDTRQYDQALVDFNTLLAFCRDEDVIPRMLNNRGNIWLIRGEFEKALQDYEGALRYWPDEPTFRYNRGRVYLKMRQYEKARNEFNVAIPAFEDYVVAAHYQHRGMANFELRRDEEAYRDFTEALRLDPRYYEAAKYRAMTLFEMQRYDEALEDCAYALRLDPKGTQAYFVRGNIYRAQKLYDKAVIAYSEVVKLNPKFADGFMNRGICYRHLKQPDKAIADLTEAIKLNPKLMNAYFNRANVYSLDKKNDKKALEDYTEAIKLDPNSPILYSARGFTYVDLNDKKKAIADFKAALAINANCIDAQRMREYIAKHGR